MKEQIQTHKSQWKRVEGSTSEAKPLSPGIQEKMTPNKTAFLWVGPVGIVVHDIKKALHPYEEVPYDDIPF